MGKAITYFSMLLNSLAPMSTALVWPSLLPTTDEHAMTKYQQLRCPSKKSAGSPSVKLQLCLLPRRAPGAPRVTPLPFHPCPPVRKYTVTLFLQAHGLGDVISNEAGLCHGIDKVSRRLENSVVCHKVCGSHTCVITKDVHC